MTKHFPIRTEESASHPITYICPCGYRSANKKEFVSVSNPSTEGVTCEKALAYLGKSVLVMSDHDTEAVP